MISRYSIVLVVGLAVATAFSFSPQQLATKQCNIQQSQSALSMQLNDDDELQRRNFLSKVVATTITPILLSSTQASAAVCKCIYSVHILCIIDNILSYLISFLISLYHNITYQPTNQQK